jgi:putative ubiquitin-RnfH superfamily antitoxin RatB of RatAB toxin-antitoxin module
MADAVGAVLRITVAAGLAPGGVREWTLQLPPGATVADALRACGLEMGDSRFACGIWGRAVPADEALRDGDRVEWCRPLRVDPKLARRQRFASQGARAAGLFSKRRPGAKAGY